jgi:hypothetical protein
MFTTFKMLNPEQIRTHRKVHADPYPYYPEYEKIILPSKPPPHFKGEEVNRSDLFMNPSKPMVSTGTMKNSYTGEFMELFENELPPPNSTKGVLATFQLKQPNHRLLMMSGNYNHHNPPPRKKELSGEVFNPVSARGGSTPFDPITIYYPKIRKRLQETSMRTIFNNRDGIAPIVPAIAKEVPWNRYGTVNRIRFMPDINPTNNLDEQPECERRVAYGNWDTATPQMKREQFTGKVYNRKSRALVDRAVLPNSFLNAVSAVTIIPTSNDYLVPHKADRQFDHTMNPSKDDGLTITVDKQLKPTDKEWLKTQVVPQPAMQASDKGQIVMSSDQLKPTSKEWLTTKGLPMANVQIDNKGGGVQILDNLKPTNKEWLTNQVVPMPAMQAPGHGGVLVSQANLKDTMKVAIAENPFRQASVVQSLENSGNVLTNLHKLRQTNVKDGVVNGQFPIVGAQFLVASQLMLPTTWKARESTTGRHRCTMQNHTMPVQSADHSIIPKQVTVIGQRSNLQDYVPAVNNGLYTDADSGGINRIFSSTSHAQKEMDGTIAAPTRCLVLPQTTVFPTSTIRDTVRNSINSQKTTHNDQMSESNGL